MASPIYYIDISNIIININLYYWLYKRQPGPIYGRECVGHCCTTIAPEVKRGEDSSEKDIVVYVPLPDWQHYDLNPSSSHYKEVYGINKFKDRRIVLAFQQVP